MIPVFVCVPAYSRISGKDGTFPSPDGNKYSSSPIGYLRGFETADICDDEMITKELAELGLVMRYHAQGVRAAHGCFGCLLSFAVEVPTYEEAVKLPGFVPFGDWTGAYYWPPTIPAELTMDLWPNSPATVKRVALADCNVKELPPYKEDGSFYVSLVTQGQIASMVFFKEDPAHVYVVFRVTDQINAVAAARECFAELQRGK